MATCASCERELRAESNFCPACGSPVVEVQSPRSAAPAPRNARALVLTTGAALVVCVGVGLFFLLRAPDPSAAQETGSATREPGSIPVPMSSTSAPVSPFEALQQQALDDAATVEGLVGYWVPQVSSKKLGPTTDGTSFGYPEILTDFQFWKATFRDAVLLRSDDFSSFNSAGYWVTMIPAPFSTAQEANGWCDERGTPADDCFAKRLSHTEAPAGNTVHR